MEITTFTFEDHHFTFSDSFDEMYCYNSGNEKVDTFPLDSDKGYTGLGQAILDGKACFLVFQKLPHPSPTTEYYPKITTGKDDGGCLVFKKINKAGVVVGVGDYRFKPDQIGKKRLEMSLKWPVPFYGDVEPPPHQIEIPLVLGFSNEKLTIFMMDWPNASDGQNCN